ncbi:hypothetical protein SAMN05444411_10888 [Lutibacter oricola]|uniref:LPXTG-motif cell wall anchor domain-containing protein n=1 Tax=Lutibacter oricola TaxID=762486 RepID=A0A1H3DXX7_9FLAO|nr:hypothetical protein [Lutibacter oricola]SDX70499.1 hypothetical protein SAMN05444411_10888 [Lutibacter oricola]
MKKKINILLLSFSLLCFAKGYSQATPPQPPIGGKPSGPANPGNILPVDGGLTYLIISGIVYGVYELRKKK